jgi:hypothetical protein
MADQKPAAVPAATPVPPAPKKFLCCLAALGGTAIEVTATSADEAVAEFRKVANQCDKAIQVSVTEVS